MSLFSRKKKTEEKKAAVSSDGKKQLKKSADFKIGKKEVGSKIKENKKPSSKRQEHKEGVNRQAYKVLVQPLITEKTTIQNSLNQYAFIVDIGANKVEVKKAIEEIYHIKPIRIRIINVLGKSVRSGRRGQTTRQRNWKKAIVTIPAGKKIDVYEGV